MLRTTLAGLACLGLAGCGTFSDAVCGPVDGHTYYRGVRLDVAAVKSGMVLMAADIPLSAVADTLLIPRNARHARPHPTRGIQEPPAMVAAVLGLVPTGTSPRTPSGSWSKWGSPAPAT